MSDYPEPDEQELEAAMQLHRRQISTETIEKFEDYAAEIFTALGMDLNTPATQDTPRRFIRALVDITAGYEGDPKLLKVFATECRGEPDCRLSQVIEGPIHFFALCEHQPKNNISIGFAINMRQSPIVADDSYRPCLVLKPCNFFYIVFLCK